MSIKRLLFSSIVAIGAIACILATTMAVLHRSRTLTIDHGLVRLDVVRALAAIPQAVNMERGLGNLLLATNTLDEASRHSGLADLRAQSDEAVTRVRRAVEAAGTLPDSGALQASATAIETGYRAARQLA